MQDIARHCFNDFGIRIRYIHLISLGNKTIDVGRYSL